uniref:nicotinamidase n=1 Tax=Lotharella oceanica TaxID=641309 RepID=A0A7S2TH99_9EUKA
MEAKAAPARRAFLIIDVQNDFLPPNGSLKVEEGDKIIPLINKLRKDIEWDLVCVSQDWHPKDHCSFVENNKGAEVLTVIELESGLKQMMWPTHCVQGSKGAEFHKELVLEETDKIVKKGTHQEVDSYSAFFDNDKKTSTEMNSILSKEKITECYIAGLAYDYCVGFSALDSKAAGFKTTVISDACRAVAPDSEKSMSKSLADAGVSLQTTEDVLKALASQS